MTGWRDVQTDPPPKDGTRVVIARHGWTSFPIAVWMEYPGNPVQNASGEDVHMSGWGHDASGFTEGHEDYWLGWDDDPMPTHWLPAPPQWRS